VLWNLNRLAKQDEQFGHAMDSQCAQPWRHSKHAWVGQIYSEYVSIVDDVIEISRIEPCQSPTDKGEQEQKQSVFHR
jgi:hypothetical protein